MFARLLVALVLMWGASVAAAFAQAAPSGAAAADFAANPTFESATLSPSGRYVAGIRNAGDVSELVIIDRQTNNGAVLQRSRQSEGTWLRWVRWKSEDRLVFGVDQRFADNQHRETGTRIGKEVDVDVYWIPRVVATNRDGTGSVQMFNGQRRRLAGNGVAPVRLTNLLRSDPQNVLLTAYDDNGLALWRANVTTGKTDKIENGNWATQGWVTDINGVVVLRTDDLPRASGNRFFRRAPGAASWTQFLELKSAADANQTEFVPFGSSGAPGQIYVTARPEGQDRAALYAFDTATGAFGTPLLAHATADIDDAVVNPVNGKVIGACAAVQRSECVGLDRTYTRQFNAIDTFFEHAATMNVVSVSDDEMVWLMMVIEPAKAPTYYVYDRNVTHIAPLLTAHDTLTRTPLGRRSVVSYTGRDGAALWGYLFNAPAAGAAPKPLVVLPHGGPESRDDVGFDTLAQYLAARGYAVFQPNFRGGAGFGRAFTEQGYRQWGRRMQDDITDGVKSLIASGAANPARVCIVGVSYGGYAALAGATLTPDLYKCVVSIAGISDLTDMLDNEQSEDGKGSVSYAYWSRAIGQQVPDKDALAAASPRRHAADVRAPVLLMHGEEDTIVPIFQSRNMERALLDAGRPVRMITFPEEDHSPYYWRVNNLTRMLMETDAFLAQNIGR